ncbi:MULTISPECIES: hypothetical protein [Sphingobium]|uniref:hypothetical protein n=1 Tax=Sphingobium TaxID=165695 RepID=UPI00242AA82A|nr:hypothetical protein [Sphingobium yanoikuyae]
MEFESIAESILFEDGVAQIAFDLSGSPAAYVIISRPEHGDAANDFFGEDHYVEVRDQLHGRYGAIETLRIVDAFRLRMQLRSSIPNIGADFIIVTRLPMSDAILNQLRALERG